MRRAAYSDTMIASSTSMPTARMSENSTTMLTVSPASCSPRMPDRNEAGIATPMNSDGRPPPEHEQHDHAHQQDRGDHAVLQFVQHRADGLRLVLRERDLDGAGPRF